MTAIIPGNTVTVIYVRQRILGREGKTSSREGGGFERTRSREIVSKATSSQIPNHETTKKKDAT